MIMFIRVNDATLGAEVVADYIQIAFAEYIHICKLINKIKNSINYHTNEEYHILKQRQDVLKFRIIPVCIILSKHLDSF